MVSHTVELPYATGRIVLCDRLNRAMRTAELSKVHHNYPVEVLKTTFILFKYYSIEYEYIKYELNCI